jgi:MerR family transcriptional regulator, heat shock protein HspR
MVPVRQREALFIISVAARLVDMHPSTLRKYERVGFLEPSRLGGKLRLYSLEDITRLRQIKYLVEERGVNIGGVELALEITEGLLRLRESLTGAVGVGARANRADEARRALVDELLRELGVEPDEPGEPTTGDSAGEQSQSKRYSEKTSDERVAGRTR